MKLYVKYDIHNAVNVIIKEKLSELGLEYELGGLGEVEIQSEITEDQLQELHSFLAKYGIDIVDNLKSTLVQKTKDVIREMIYKEEGLPTSKISSYIAERVNRSYGYLHNLFAENTYTSIGNYIIMQKIERAKQLIMEGELTLTEISYKLSYSSVAHLSYQFKKTTGLTPSAFQRIIKRRRGDFETLPEKETSSNFSSSEITKINNNG
ncbi:MAG TPA: AraC family transcriptional regulator [Lentimicrobium sp.]|nr:AraC family transcriptional regulator [Lentimicrobium sp.]